MSFPAQPFGFVAGRWVRSIGDTPDDADRAPDYVPVETGTVVFTPQVTHRVAVDGTGWAGIIKERIPARLGERGQLIDAEGHDHLALAVGVYSVSYDFGSSRSWPSHYIEVKTTHTADSPLWLPPIAPPPEGPMIENRVVTIPADGEDGQVLVWDGAGFTWDFPPEGPQGPPGEVTTAALTTALAGKVTGTGMEVRHDTTVGERVLLDHPGGTTMLYGDTGWRDVTPSLPNGNMTAGQILIRRVNNNFHVHLKNIMFTEMTAPSTLATFATVGGMIPQSAVRSTFDIGDGDLIALDEVMVYGGVTSYVRWQCRKEPNQRTSTVPATTKPRSGYTTMMLQTEAWPTTLPGTPL